MYVLKNFLRKNWGKLTLLILAILAVFLLSKGKNLSDDYQTRVPRKTSVDATITNIEEKTRTETTTYDIGEDTKTFTDVETYYLITAVYQYNGKEYTCSFNTDYLHGIVSNENEEPTEINYEVGNQCPLEIDSQDPSYVVSEDPGADYRVGGYIAFGLFALIIFLWILVQFSESSLFTAPWLIAALTTLMAGIYILITDDIPMMGFLLIFIITPMYLLAYYVFYKLSKLPEK